MGRLLDVSLSLWAIGLCSMGEVGIGWGVIQANCGASSGVWDLACVGGGCGYTVVEEGAV